MKFTGFIRKKAVRVLSIILTAIMLASTFTMANVKDVFASPLSAIFPADYYILNPGIAIPGDEDIYSLDKYSEAKLGTIRVSMGGKREVSKTPDINRFVDSRTQSPIKLEKGQTINWYYIGTYSCGGFYVEGIITPQNYKLNINYVDENNKIIKDYNTLQEATSNYEVQSPNIEGYTIKNEKDKVIKGTMPYKDVTVNVNYTQNKYKVEFVDSVNSNNDKTLSPYVYKQKVQSGINKVPTVATEPFVKNSVEYTFSGWSDGNTIYSFDEIANMEVKSNLRFNACYNTKAIEVKFVNNDGSIISTNYYKNGDTVIKPDNPEYAGDTGIYTYSFSNWKDLSNNTGFTEIASKSVIYTAEYCKAIQVTYYKYLTPVDAITDFYDQDIIEGRDTSKFTQVGETLIFKEPSSELVKLLTEAYSKTPKNSTRHGTNLQEDISKVVALTEQQAGVANTVDCWYVLKYESDGWHIDGGKYNSYLIAFKYLQYAGSYVFAIKGYHIGDSVRIPSYPTKVESPSEIYTFKNWTPDYSEICKGEATYVAQYDVTDKEYTVTFNDYSGAHVNKYKYDSSIDIPQPAVKPDDIYSYEFVKWVPQGNYTVDSKVTENMVFEAEYEKHYKVTFTSDGVSSTSQYKGTDSIIVPSDPIKTPTAALSYRFNTWMLKGSAISKEAIKAMTINDNFTFIASFTETKNKYLVTFTDASGSNSTDYYYDSEMKVPKASEKPEDDYKYSFVKWVPQGNYTIDSKVTENMVFKAEYEKRYKVTFISDGTSSSDYYKASENIAVPTDPEKPSTNAYSYSFKTWTLNGEAIGKETIADMDIEDNIEFIASFTETKNKYLVTFTDASGSNSTDYYYDSEMKVPKASEKKAEGYTYSFTKWVPQGDYTIDSKVDMNMEFVAEYKGTKIVPQVEPDKDDVKVQPQVEADVDADDNAVSLPLAVLTLLSCGVAVFEIITAKKKKEKMN